MLTYARTHLHVLTYTYTYLLAVVVPIALVDDAVVEEAAVLS